MSSPWTAVLEMVRLLLPLALYTFLLKGLTERLVFSSVPCRLHGVPIRLITAGLLALAFLGAVRFLC